MRFRSVVIFPLITCLIWAPSAFSQKRIYAKVDPNGHEKAVLADIATLKS